MSNETNFLSSVNRAFSEVKAWKTATFVLGAVTCMLAWQLVQTATNQPVVLVPHNLATDTGRQVVTTNGEIRGTSAEYMANMAMSDISLIANFTPENVITTHKRFLNRLTDSLYASQESKLLAIAADHKTQGVTQSFFPSTVKATPSGTLIEVQGTLLQSIAGKETLRTRITYVISYQVYKGFMHVSDLRQK